MKSNLNIAYQAKLNGIVKGNIQDKILNSDIVKILFILLKWNFLQGSYKMLTVFIHSFPLLVFIGHQLYARTTLGTQGMLGKMLVNV